MVNAAVEYRKNGFNDQDAAQLAQVSSMFQNVADESISTGDAAQFLISQLIAFNKTTGDVEGNAMHIADALNEVANNFAVGTGDLATGLKVVASSSAGMNNSFEQTIGLMTAITEQTKNASKASRGLNSIMANLAQVLDDASSNGKKITEIFEQLGVEMYENGQLKSGYDLLAGLAEKWNTLDNNSQKYIATTVAGTTQLNNFLALMNNFDHAVSATNTALESQGSAMRENSAYMESIQAKLSQLQSTFQDFANNVISSDLAKAVLDLANGLLQIANTDLGQIVTQIVLLTGLGWGATSLTKALGIFKVGIEQFKILGQVAGAAGAAGGITSVADAFAALSLAGGAALPIILGVATALAVGGALWKATEDSRKSFSELNEEIKDNSTKLETNKQRLQEISNIPWNEKTQDIIDEKTALEKENQELQDQIDKLEKLQKVKAGQTGGGTAGGITITGMGSVKGYNEFVDRTFKSMEELTATLRTVSGQAVYTAEDLDKLGITYTTLESKAKDYTRELKLTNQISEEHQADFIAVKQAAQDQIDIYDKLIESGQDLTDVQQQEYDTLQAFISQVDKSSQVCSTYSGTVSQLSYDTSQAAVRMFEFGVKTGETKEKMRDLVAQQVIFNNSGLNVIEKIAAMQDLATAAGGAAAAIAAVSTVSSSDFERTVSGKLALSGGKLSREAATQQVLQSIWKSMFSTGVTTKTGINTGNGSGTSSGSKSSATKKYTDTALEQFKSLQKNIEHQLNLGEITEEEYYAKLEELVKQYKTNATAHMKEYGLNVNQINQNMYQYEEEIYKGRAKLADNLADQQKKAAEEAAQAEKEALEQQRSDYEKAVNYIVNKIDEQINKLEQQKSDIEKFYDDQIQALQDTNDELERQIQYEQLLNNLAQAKDKGLYVFSNGQFQYVQDVEVISAAQAELDAYERDEALRKEVENLNKLKDQATASIDAQIKQWEKYKEEWSNVVNQYDEEQNRLLVSQILGIDTEKANWETRLANLQSFVDQYNSILSQLNSGMDAGSGIGGSSNGSSNGVGATSIGGGLSYSPKTGKFYDTFGNLVSGVSTVTLTDEQRAAKLSAEEAYERQHTKDTGGFLDDEGYATADDGKTKIKFTGSAGGGSKYSIKTASMERRTDLAGKVVKVGNETITYNNGGYAVSKKIDHNAAGTLSAPGGLSLVGEQGPELRVLGQGDGVLPADITRNLWDWGKINPNNIGGNTTHIFNIDNLTLPNANDAKSLVAGLKNLAYQRAYKRA